MILPAKAQTVEDARRHYDDLDPVYRQIWGLHVHHGYWLTGKETPEVAVEALVDLVAEQLLLSPLQEVCDIGSGYGAAANHIAHRYDVSVTGLTISAAQARIAATLRPSAGSFVCLHRDWLSNGLSDQRFDRAYAIESSEHMSDKAEFFREAWRTLRPGGRLVVCAWLAGSRPSAMSVRYLLEPICREGRLAGMGNKEEYDRMAQEAGFTLLDFRDITSNVRRTWSICARRLLYSFLSDQRFRAMVFNRELKDRMFLWSIPRLMIAMRVGAMRYGLFTWRRG